MDDRLRQLQLTELKIMDCFVDICKKNNLEYFLLGGSFLGAIRHKGFIPWDDDMDVGMPRKDYDRLFEIIDDLLPDNYVFRNFKKGNESTIYFSRIEDLSFEIIDNSANVKRKRYAWIDIFPIDGMPNNIIVRNIHKFNLLYRRMLLQYSNFSVVVNQNLPNRPLFERMLIKFGNIFNVEKLLDTDKCLNKLDKQLRKYRYEDSDYVVNFSGAYKFKEMFKKDIYMNKCLYQFEDRQYYAPKEYDFVLKQMYGDYMQVPKDVDKYKHNIKV